MRSATLRVKESLQRDAGRGIARIDSAVMRDLGLSPGDLIEVKGGRATVAKALPGYPQDKDLGIIRIDGTIRANAKAGIDDRVNVRKVEAEPAEKVVLAPVEPVMIEGGEELIARALDSFPVTAGDKVRLNFFGTVLDFAVVSVKPQAEAAIITPQTRIEVSEKTAAEAEKKITKITYEDIGGLGDQIQRIREMIELPLRYPQLFEKLGIEPPKGILLHGPPGTGKTLIAKAVAYETDAHFTTLNGPEIMSKYYGESEARLREIFDEAEKKAPSIIFIDEIDAIAPKREEVTGEVERRVVAQLLGLMDGLKSRGQVVVIGATNRPNAIDPALRRPGRFDREIEIGVPNRQGRLEILQIHTRGMPLAEDVDLEKIADVTHGFVGADLQSLCKEAAMRSLRRVIPGVDLKSRQLPPEVLDKLQVTMGDFTEALKDIEPSAMREIYIEKPNVRWDDIGDLENAKQSLIESVEWPLKYPSAFEYAKTTPPKGILLYGPPGTGKTLLAKALATESQANFISVKGPELLSKWVGESEKGVRETFRKAKQSAPCIVFFDEIDSVAPTRGASADSHVTERVVSQLLTELDGLEALRNIVVVAATNRPDLIDPALLRPGRFDRLIYVNPPDRDGRLKILQVHLKGKPLAGDVDPEQLAEKMEGYVGADIEAVVREASMHAIRGFVTRGKEGSKPDFKIGKADFERALSTVRPVGKARLREYERWAEEFESSFS